MIEIIINPGDIFEHSHNHVSTSKILQGSAKITIGDKELIMYEGDEMEVPENTSHSIENIGDIPLRLWCGHYSRT